MPFRTSDDRVVQLVGADTRIGTITVVHGQPVGLLDRRLGIIYTAEVGFMGSLAAS
jgi:hypothetical protein